jgi:hypothetical protein
MTPTQIKQVLKQEVAKLHYLSSEAKSAMLSQYNELVSSGKNAKAVFTSLLDSYGDSIMTPQEILSRHESKASQSNAGLLGDDTKPKSHYETRVEYIKKRFKLDSLSFVGMEPPKPTDIQKTQTEQKVSLGSQARYQGKTFDATLDITVF